MAKYKYGYVTKYENALLLTYDNKEEVLELDMSNIFDDMIDTFNYLDTLGWKIVCESASHWGKWCYILRKEIK